MINPGCGNNIIACGSVVVGQYHNVDSMTTLKDSTEDTFDQTSAAGAPYKQPYSFTDMSGTDKAYYSGNIIQVLDDYLGMWAPHYQSDNIFIFVDWKYYKDIFTVPQIHLINYTLSEARIAQVRVTAPDSQQYIYGELKSVGRFGAAPGTINFNLSNIPFSRKNSIYLTIFVKVAAAPLPIGSQIIIPGNNLNPGLSEPMLMYNQP